MEQVSWSPFEDRRAYVCAAFERLREQGRRQTQWIRDGLHQVIPAHITQLLGWSSLRTMVIGAADYDVDLLQSDCYCSWNKTGNMYRWFWQTIRQFTPELRAAFLRFVWGQSTLPEKGSPAYQRFSLSSASSSYGDAALPRAATCSFELYIPTYTSQAALKDRLTYAIQCTTSIDNDGSTPNDHLVSSSDDDDDAF